MKAIFLLAVSLITFCANDHPATDAFVLPSTQNDLAARPAFAPTSIEMGLFDGIMKAFENDEYGPPPDAIKATARHILVKTAEDAAIVKEKLLAGGEFASLAGEYSTCPSSGRGGSLGSFGPGTMVPEFDKVVFSPDTVIGSIIGPVETDFGYHLIVVDKRTGGGDWY